MCLAGKLIRQQIALWVSWELIYEYLIYEDLTELKSRQNLESAQTHNHGAHMHKNTHIFTYIYAGTQTHSLTQAQICCYSSAVLWAP